MRKFSRLVILSSIFCLGCVTGAVNPFYTSESVVSVPELNGKWYGLEKNEKGDELRTPLEIVDGKIMILEKDDAPDEGALTFFKVDDQLFADMQLEKDEGEEDAPPHLLFKILQDADQITFVPLDYDWFQAEIGAGNIDLPLIRDEDKRSVLFTASAPQWVAFIKAHKDDVYAFPLKDQFVLIRGN